MIMTMEDIRLEGRAERLNDGDDGCSGEGEKGKGIPPTDRIMNAL